MELEMVVVHIKNQYKDITLIDFARNLDYFKKEYNKVMLIFPYYKQTPLIEQWRDFIYSLNMELYKRDRIWEALNDDITKEDLDKFVRGVYYGR